MTGRSRLRRIFHVRHKWRGTSVPFVWKCQVCNIVIGGY